MTTYTITLELSRAEVFDLAECVGSPDMGPEGYGWRSDERLELADKVDAAIKRAMKP